MKLVAKKVVKPELEGKDYLDMFLVFDYKGEECRVRVRPVFWHDMGILRKVYELVE